MSSREILTALLRTPDSYQVDVRSLRPTARLYGIKTRASVLSNDQAVQQLDTAVSAEKSKGNHRSVSVTATRAGLAQEVMPGCSLFSTVQPEDPSLSGERAQVFIEQRMSEIST